MAQIVDMFLHLDVHLASLSQAMGLWLYLVLFLIIFAETGLVVTPFLPGDSLLFATGALCAVEGSGLNIHLMAPLLLAAAIMGDSLNYCAGRFLGRRIFNSEHSWLLNPNHVVKTEDFYRRHGPFTVVIARFVPIIRTFAPFVAGLGKMPYRRFIGFSVGGGIAWVAGFTYAGFFFGNIPAIKRNFEYVILGIIAVSVMPIVLEWLKRRRKQSA
jgi:membrane-associated protein